MRLIKKLIVLLVGAVVLFSLLRRGPSPKKSREEHKVSAHEELVESPPAILNASHRCDGCGARAYAMAWMRIRTREDLVEFLFCRHHWHKMEDHSLFEYYVDETDRVLQG